jgi:PAS domain S-box-containing protein
MSKNATTGTTLRGAAQELEGVPELFYAFAEQFPGGVFIKDSQSRLVYLNPYITETLGAEGWLTKSPDQFLAGEHADPLLESDKMALEQGPVDVQLKVPDKDGNVRLWRSLRFPIERPDREPLIGVIALDVTEKRRAEAALREQQAHYRAIVENFPDGFVCLFDRDNRFTLARGKGFDLTKRRPEEVEGKTIYDIFTSPELEIIEKHHNAALAGETSAFEIEFNGNPYEVTTVPVQDATGEIVAGMALIRLVSDRYRTRNFMHRREQEYRALVENAQDIIARFDRNYRLLYINPAFERITNLPAAWFRNMKIDELHLPWQSLQDFFEALNTVFRTGEEQSIEVKYTPKRGVQTFQIRLTPEFDPEGEVETVLGVGRDISGHKKLESELRRAKEDAEAASLAKSEFLANMSHEIRTPMNAMLGYMDLISDDALEPAERGYLGIVKDSAETLLTIINDILDYSKIEAGKIELESKTFDPGSVLETVVREHAVLADQKGLELSWKCGPNLPSSLVGDISRLKQILRNLISNALKFTEDGSVTVRVDRDSSPAPAGRARLRFSVSDTGIGLSADLKDKLFESFTQFESGMRKKYKGTGLGLAICRKLAGLLGGNIWVESESGKGSTFSFTAVFDEARRSPLEEPEYKTERGGGSIPALRILLAEDNEVNRTFLTDLLLDHGHTVNTAENGEQALSKLKNEKYDLVLMDVQMPVMDGMEATRLIRSSGEPGIDAQVPVIGLSAYAMSEHRERFIKAGMNAFVSKPVNFELLFGAIAGVLENPSAPAPEHDPEPARPDPGPGKGDHDAELLDEEGINDHYAKKGKMFSRLCTMFFESARDNFAKIEDAFRERDFARIQKPAHAIRGSAASMGAQALSLAAARLEEAASEKDEAAVAEKLRRLEDVFEPSLEQLGALKERFKN